MKSILCRAFTGLALLLLASQAQAVITCAASSGGFASAYDPMLATKTIVQTYATVTCTRAGGDASTVSYTLGVNNGMNPQGINNRAAGAGTFMRYDVYQDSACGTQWKGATAFSGILNFGGGTTASVNLAYWGCITASQTTLPAGTYSDTVTLTLSYGPNPQSTAISTFGVNVSTLPQCSIGTMPTLDFGTYIAYGSALSSSISFVVTCTRNMVYTLAVTPGNGTIAGVNYTVAPRLSSLTGSGLADVLYIDGSMPGGQPGTYCGLALCSETKPHQLVVTY